MSAVAQIQTVTAELTDGGAAGTEDSVTIAIPGRSGETWRVLGAAASTTDGITADDTDFVSFEVKASDGSTVVMKAETKTSGSGGTGDISAGGGALLALETGLGTDNEFAAGAVLTAALDKGGSGKATNAVVMAIQLEKLSV